MKTKWVDVKDFKDEVKRFDIVTNGVRSIEDCKLVKFVVLYIGVYHIFVREYEEGRELMFSILGPGWQKLTKVERWRGRVGEEYYFTDEVGDQITSTEYNESSEDAHWINYNYWQTEEQEREAARRQLTVRKQYQGELIDETNSN